MQLARSSRPVLWDGHGRAPDWQDARAPREEPPSPRGAPGAPPALTGSAESADELSNRSLSWERTLRLDRVSRLLATHPRLMWLSASPSATRTSRSERWASTADGYSLLGRLLGKKIRPKEPIVLGPVCYAFRALPGPRPADVTPGSETGAGPAPSRCSPRRATACSQDHGGPGSGFSRIFEDGQVPSTSSVTAARWQIAVARQFWRGGMAHGWARGLLSPADQATGKGYDRSFVALAGHRVALRCGHRSGAPAWTRSSFLEVRSEDFCQGRWKPTGASWNRGAADSAEFERSVKAAIDQRHEEKPLARRTEPEPQACWTIAPRGSAALRLPTHPTAPRRSGNRRTASRPSWAAHARGLYG